MTQSPTRQAAIRILQAGPDMPVAIREREKELRAMADDIGMDYSKDIIQKSRTSTTTENIVAALKDGDLIRNELVRVDMEYLRIMAALTSKQRLFVYLRYRKGMPLRQIAENMGVTLIAVERLSMRVAERIESLFL